VDYEPQPVLNQPIQIVEIPKNTAEKRKNTEPNTTASKIPKYK